VWGNKSNSAQSAWLCPVHLLHELFGQLLINPDTNVTRLGNGASRMYKKKQLACSTNRTTPGKTLSVNSLQGIANVYSQCFAMGSLWSHDCPTESSSSFIKRRRLLTSFPRAISSILLFAVQQNARYHRTTTFPKQDTLPNCGSNQRCHTNRTSRHKRTNRRRPHLQR